MSGRRLKDRRPSFVRGPRLRAATARSPARSSARRSVEVLLDESRAEMHVHLHEWTVADAAEAVHLTGFDHEDVARARLELASVDDPPSAALLNELHLVVRMTMRTGTGTGLTVEEEHRDVVAVRVANLEEKARLLAAEPAAFFTEPHYNGFPAILVRLDAVSVADLKGLIAAAWQCRAPVDLKQRTGRPRRTPRP